MQIGHSGLERKIWQVKLVSGDQKINESVDKVYEIYGEITEKMENQIEDGTSREELSFGGLFDKANEEIDGLVEIMSKDIRRWF